MFREYGHSNKEHINFLFDDGGIGDNIARLPVIKYILDNFDHIIPHVWIPDYFLDFAKNLLPIAIIKPFSKGDKEYNSKLAGRKTSCLQHSNMGTHMVDNAFHILIDKQVDNIYKNYLQLDLDKINIEKFTLPEKYVVIPTGFTAEVREMLPQVVNELSDYVISKGYTPLFLGSKVAKTGVKKITSGESPSIKATFNSEIDYTKGLDLIDKTTLLEAGKIIAKAKVIVGLDCGLLHVASCTNIPIVGGFTTVNPLHRMAYRHDILGWNYHAVVPTTDLRCRFCQSNWEFVFSHDYRKCYYKEQKLDKEIQCVKQLASDKYIKKLEKIL